jgi:RNA polymerase sigma factor (sigma-70 family)
MDQPSTKPAEAATSAKALRAGAALVIASLSQRLGPALRNYFKRRRIPRDDVEDLVQDVFTRLAARPNVESLERPEGYLFATASNLLRDRHRRMTARAAEDHESYEEARHGAEPGILDPERALLSAQMIVKLGEALLELPARSRTIFILYHLEDLSHQEIAQRTGVAISTIERHMSRVNAHLLTRMEGLWR